MIPYEFISFLNILYLLLSDRNSIVSKSSIKYQGNNPEAAVIINQGKVGSMFSHHYYF